MNQSLLGKDSSFSSQLKAYREQYRQFCRERSDLPLYLDPHWLDTVCGDDGWSAAIAVDRSGQLNFALPFQWSYRYRLFRFLHTPLFTPYVGPLLVKDPDKRPVHAFLHGYQDMVQQAMMPWQRVRFIRWKLHYTLPHDLPFRWQGMHNKPRATFLIRPGHTPEEHFARLDKNIQRDIRQAQRKYRIVEVTDREAFTSLAIGHLEERRVGNLAVYRQAMMNILHEYQGSGRLKAWLTTDEQGKIMAGALFVADADSVYYLAAFRDTRISNNQGNSLLVWQGIEWALKDDLIFDFEGSNIPGVASYFRRFGAEQIQCIEVYRP